MKRKNQYLLLFLIIAVSIFSTGVAFAAEAFWPDADYDPSVPTFNDVLGYAPGERISSHAEIVRYLRTLAQAKPGRMSVIEYARSWEGRELVYAVIGSQKNIARLESLSTSMQQLSDPRTTRQPEADEIIAEIPAPVWLGYAVHGDEISTCDAAMLTAYHLLASRNDPVVENVLKNTVVFIDPVQNPDGRDRFVNFYRSERGLLPDASRLAAEHNQPWPSGRGNHYLFDMNRDWFSLTQPETQGRITALLKRRPIVVVDLHEMGGDSTYYFTPPAPPNNPHLTSQQSENLMKIGKGNAAWFDKFGFDYFTREIYDSFYPGYGESWPAFYGASTATYEQASTSGLLWQRRNGDILRFRDAVQHHFVASIATLDTTAKNREQFLRDYYEFQVSAIKEGNTGKTRAYVLPLTGDISLVHKLAGLLTRQGVEVLRAKESFTAGGKVVGVGSYIIPMAQPMKRFIATMFEQDVPMAEDFVREQERRRNKNLYHEMYDTTAWSFPHLFNIESIAVQSLPRVETDRASKATVMPGTIVNESATVAYLVPWGTTAAARLLAVALREELIVLSSGKSFTQSGRRYPAGTLIFKTEDNPTDLPQRLGRFSRTTGADVVGIDSSWVDEGVHFGSEHVIRVRPPKIAIAWGRPTSPTSAGAIRFIIEREFGYPTTTIRTRDLNSVDLARFNVLILPAGDYSTVFSGAALEHLQKWVNDGGTMIGLGSATSFLASKAAGLLSVNEEFLVRKADKDGERKSSEEEKEDRVAGRLLNSEIDYRKAIQAQQEMPDDVPGVMLKAYVDQDHWLAAGLPKMLNALYVGHSIMTPLTLDKGVNVAYYAGAEEALLSGYLWEENRKQLAYKPFILIEPRGRGQVIAFTTDPAPRAYLDGLYVALINAVFLAPSHTSPPA